MKNLANKQEKVNKQELSSIHPSIPKNQVFIYDRFEIYIDKGKYYTLERNKPKRLSNFILTPEAIIKNEEEGTSVYVYRIKNDRENIPRAVYFSADDLITLKNFRRNITNLGKYSWKGSEAYLNDLIEMLNEKMDTAKRITNLFWQESEKFWAWGNGISTTKGEFIPCNDLGFVENEGRKYFIEAAAKDIAARNFSSTNIEKHLVYTENQISKSPLSLFKQIIDIFGNNGKIVIAFYLVSLFSDYIFKLQTNLPILGMFGYHGTGKTTLIMSILNTLYSSKEIPPVKLNNATQSGVAKRLMLANNALVFLDEYNDKVNTDKADFQSIIRDVYNRTARVRESSQEFKDLKITTMAMVAGEQSPTDAALVERMIFFRILIKEITGQQKEQYRDFSEFLENNTMTHITHELLKYRPFIEQHYKEVSHKVQDELEDKLKDLQPSRRIIENYASLISVFRIIEHQNKNIFPFDSKNITAEMINTITNHVGEFKNIGVINNFWMVMHELYQNGEIGRDIDYKIENISIINLEKTKYVPDNITDISVDKKSYLKRYTVPKTIIHISFKKIYGKYKMTSKKLDYRPLDEANLKYNLSTSKEFIGNVRQKKIGGKNHYTYVFDYSMLNIDLE